MKQPIRVFIVDDHTLIRDAFACYLEHHDQIRVIGHAGTDAEELAGIAATRPDVVLIAISFPAVNGIEAAEQLKTAHPNLKLLALSVHGEETCLMPFITAGGLGYIRTTASGAELLQAIEQTNRGEAYLSPAGVQVMVKGHHTVPDPEADENLSDVLSEREKQVLIGIIHGYNMRQIGEKLFLSKSTIETYKKRVFEKLGFTSKADMVAYAIKHQLYKE